MAGGTDMDAITKAAFDATDRNLAETHCNLHTPGYCFVCGLPVARPDAILCATHERERLAQDLADREHEEFERE
jgi:hypothetical protein